VFDPREDPVNQAEREAFRELYRSQVGREPDDEPDLRQASEQAGLLRGVGARGAGARRLRDRDEPPVFASAADALDFLSGEVGDFVSERIPKLIQKGVRRTPIGRIGGIATDLGIPQYAAEQALRGARFVGGLPTAGDEPGTRGEETIGEAAAGTGMALARIATAPAAVSLPSIRRGISQTPFLPTPSGIRGLAGGPQAVAPGAKTMTTYGDVNEMFLDMSANPNQYIDASSDIKEPVPGAEPWLVDMMQRSAEGELPAMQRSLLSENLTREQYETPFPPMVDQQMRYRAEQNGFDTSNWAATPVEEKIFQASNKNDYFTLLGRNLVRGVGELGATPAGVAAIVDATTDAAGGDTTEAMNLIRGSLQPYGFAYSENDRIGFFGALLNFARDNPMEFVLALNIAARTASRAGGIAGRAGALGARGRGLAQAGRRVTVGGAAAQVVPTPRAVPEVRSGTWLQDTIERERVLRENAALRERVAAGEVETIRPEVLVGYSGRGLVGNVALAARQRYAGSTLPFAERYRGRLQRRPAFRETQLQANVVDNVRVEIANILTEAIGRDATPAVKQRVAWNLNRSGVMFDEKTPLTPKVEAAFYRQKSEELVAQRKRDGERLDAEDQKQIRRWNEAANYLDELERVEVDPAVMARVREAAMPLGRQNDILISESVVGETPMTARRANYIRLTVLDPEFEIKARARRSEVNRGIAELVKVQKRVQRLSRIVLRFGDETGWGSYGRSKSVARYESVRADLLKNLLRGAQLARRAGDEEMAARFSRAAEEMGVARLGGEYRRERAREAVASLSGLNLPEERLAELPEQARGAYEAARAAEAERAAQERVVSEVEAERAGVLESLGMRRAGERELGLAQQRAELLRDDVERLLSFPTPDAKAVARAKAKLAKAEERVAGLASAVEIGARLSAEKVTLKERLKARDAAVREAKRVLETGNTVLDTGEIRAAIDVSERFAVVQIKGWRAFDAYTIARARNEVLDEFIARVEATDQGAVLHLVQTPDFESLGSIIDVRGPKTIDLTPGGGPMRAGRLKRSEGFFFETAQESAQMWENLLFDTAELVAAAGWRKKMQELVDATSIKFQFTKETLERAQEMVNDGVALTEQEALQRVIRAQGIEYEITDFVVINPRAPRATKPSERVSFGVTRGTEDVELGDMVRNVLNERTIDPESPGEYYLMPRRTWDGIQDALEKDAYRVRPKKNTATGGFFYRIDQAARAWRTLTLNVLPRTAVNNFIGSTMLAIMAGAGPRAFYYAALALRGVEVGPDGKKMPMPAELRQRYFEQQTAAIGGVRRKPGDLRPPTLAEGAFSWIGWWMNSMRKINGMSEDFGRLAVWYSRAYPYAIKNSPEGRRFMGSAQRLNDGAIEMLDAMANRDPNFLLLHQRWMQESMDFLGNLHQGGRAASIMRIAVPFWQWYAHMLKLTFFTMPAKYPGRALFIQQLSELGAMYQEAHGVQVPYAEDFIPFFQVETEVGGMTPQTVTIGRSTGGWWPLQTVADLGSRSGSLSTAPGSLASYFNPVITNSMLIGMAAQSALSGEPVEEFDRNGALKEARDQYGLPIDSWRSGQFWEFVFNKFFRMVPLSPTLMSSSGRASNALPFPGRVYERQTESFELPEEFEQQRRGDIASVVDDPKKNFAAFMWKILGFPEASYPGYGPIWRERQERDWESFLRDEARRKDAEDANTAQSVAEIHAQ
jgi:hypothetical protein